MNFPKGIQELINKTCHLARYAETVDVASSGDTFIVSKSGSHSHRKLTVSMNYFLAIL